MEMTAVQVYDDPQMKFMNDVVFVHQKMVCILSFQLER